MSDSPVAPQHRTALVVFVSVLLLVMAVSLTLVAPYALAVVMGGILSILARPLYRRLLGFRLRPRWAALATVLGLFFLVVGPLGLFGFLAVKQGITLGEHFASQKDFSPGRLVVRLSHWGPITRWIGDPQTVERQLRSGLQAGARSITSSMLGLLGRIPDLFLQGVLGMITCFFLLTDAPRLKLWAQDKIPLDRDLRARLSRTFEDTAISVIWATLAAAAAQSFMMGVSFGLLGVPMALLAAGCTFIFAWIPVIGSTPVWVAGALYLYSRVGVGSMLLMLAAGLVTGIIDNLIRPLVLRGRGDMHPLVSLVSIFGGIQLFGILGVFLGPILVALLLGLLEVWPSVAQRFGLLSDVGTPESSGADLGAPPGLRAEVRAEVSSESGRLRDGHSGR